MRLLFFGDSVGNRTPVAAVRGLSLNRWTTEPKHYYSIIRSDICLSFFYQIKNFFISFVFNKRDFSLSFNIQTSFTACSDGHHGDEINFCFFA